MKKIISFVVLFVALVPLNASAQSLKSEIVGTWVGEVGYFDDNGSFMIPAIALSHDGSGGMAIAINGSSHLDNGTSMNFSLTIGAPIQWSCSGTTFNWWFNHSDCEIEVDEININSNDPELNAILSQMRPTIEQMIIKEIQNIIPELPNDNTFTNVRINGNTMTAVDGDETVTFTRSDD